MIFACTFARASWDTSENRMNSFSKSDEMHEACLKLFLHRYNAEVILR